MAMDESLAVDSEQTFTYFALYRSAPELPSLSRVTDDNSWGCLLIEINYIAKGSFQINELSSQLENFLDVVCK